MKWFCISRSRLSVICVIGLALTVGGCMNVAAQLTPEDPQVQRLRKTSDCVPIIFGLAYGTATLESALTQKARLLSNYNEPKALISKIRSVVLHDYFFLFFGSRCMEVTGE